MDAEKQDAINVYVLQSCIFLFFYVPSKLYFQWLDLLFIAFLLI